jgi:hypothetical protein
MTNANYIHDEGIMVGNSHEVIEWN